ncbi:MAG: DUF2442 domain-containing protein [Acidobacteriota bacterium]|nr:DUF2442 domain-containing protein [Acidobacteriota bacterium]
MAKTIKAGKWEYTEEELQQMFEEATRRGEEAMKTEIRASSARYDQKANRLVLELKNGATFIAPCDLIQGLRGAAPELIAKVKLGPRGATLHWSKLDVDFTVGGLLEGRFGTKKWMERLPELLAETKSSARRQTRTRTSSTAKTSSTNGRKRIRQVA